MFNTVRISQNNLIGASYSALSMSREHLSEGTRPFQCQLRIQPRPPKKSPQGNRHPEGFCVRKLFVLCEAFQLLLCDPRVIGYVSRKYRRLLQKSDKPYISFILLHTFIT
jgi:hypothetical protein